MGAQACCSEHALRAVPSEEAVPCQVVVKNEADADFVACCALAAAGASANDFEVKRGEEQQGYDWKDTTQIWYESTGNFDQDSVASEAQEEACPPSEASELQDPARLLTPGDPAVAEYDTACAIVKFQHSGPKGMGLLMVTFKSCSIAPHSFGDALRTLALVTHECIRADFTTVFDLSEMIVPSPFVLPRLLNTLKAHLVHLDSWRKYQQAFSVVLGESALFDAIVGAVGSTSQARNRPVFAKDQAEARELLSQLP
eukprot:TRINITY_DN10806_c0_g1_i1.p1 TRINITY_DN10806_c0_g1~~TRINITY_DN10806_c0_g1_i1.p1  ORF type:complete len:256 (-),score=46.61 TRINITY_DN10806_c0_g1_i1:157-924(-)